MSNCCNNRDAIADSLSAGDRDFDAFIATVHSQTGTSRFDLALVLGSGLGQFLASARRMATFDYRSYPAYPAVATVAGQGGMLHAVEWCGHRILLFNGRFHLYQGLNAWQTTVPIRIAAALGCRKALLTSAVGGIHPDYTPGDLLYITDHLNLTGDNPLRGLPAPHFLSLTELYRTDFCGALQLVATEAQLHSGVLAALPGPSYETPAEIRMLERLGADAVGMSLVAEAIMAKALGLEVVGLSLISNRAAGINGSSPSHGEVLTAAERAEGDFARICEELCRLWLA